MDSQRTQHETDHEVRNSINKKRRTGRPPLLPEEKRRCQVKVGFTPAQFEILSKRAENASLAEAEFIRRACINQPIYTIPQVNSRCLIELNRLGTNVNQIAKIANSKSDFNALSELQKITEELQKIGLQIASLK